MNLRIASGKAQKDKFIRILIFILLISCAHYSAFSHAGNENLPFEEAISQSKNVLIPLPKQKPTADILTSGEQSVAPSSQLNQILGTIKQLKSEINAKENLLKKADTAHEKTILQDEINNIKESLAQREKSFEIIQTGGLESVKLSDTPDESTFDWQKELLEILKPIMSELHQLTEDRRKLASLQTKIPFLESQILDIEKSLEYMEQVSIQELEKDTLAHFEERKKKWQNRLEEKKQSLEVSKVQLKELLKSQTEKKVSVLESFKEFFENRGTTLLFVVIAVLVVCLFFYLFWKAVIWITYYKQEGKKTFFQRILKLIFYVTATIISITAIFIVLNIRNDDVLIGITVLLLIVIIWTLRNYIPLYLKELQLLLNAGPVREFERIIYNGVPMKIGALNYYTKLSNPALPGLKLRLRLSELSNFNSRPYTENELWFPCQVGDYVILSDGRFGKVKYISLEHVQLSLSNEMMPQTLTMQAFMENSPKNLSQGFVAVSVIGIDYKHQQQSTTEIPLVFKEGIRSRLLQENYGHALISSNVFFEQANTSSLDYKIIAIFDGAAAGDYEAIQRDLQRFAVDICNQQHWQIPFTNIVVHNVDA